ncbi:hypothetical protein F2981_21830 (plasmid) [Sinorhizobium meliloti]|nr:hypothetical protein [Sinorhizobium meliloti]
MGIHEFPVALRNHEGAGCPRIILLMNTELRPAPVEHPVVVYKEFQIGDAREDVLARLVDGYGCQKLIIQSTILTVKFA